MAASADLTSNRAIFARLNASPCGVFGFVGTLNNKGSWAVSVNENGKWKNVLAHRYLSNAYWAPSGFEVMHLGDTPSLLQSEIIYGLVRIRRICKIRPAAGKQTRLETNQHFPMGTKQRAIVQGECKDFPQKTD